MILRAAKTTLVFAVALHSLSSYSTISPTTIPTVNSSDTF
jgi:hypothetical protein